MSMHSGDTTTCASMSGSTVGFVTTCDSWRKWTVRRCQTGSASRSSILPTDPTFSGKTPATTAGSGGASPPISPTIGLPRQGSRHER